LKSGGKRKVGSKRGHGALEVIIPNQTNTAAVESSQEPNDNSDNDSELEARDLGSDGSELEAGALGSDADMPEFKKGDKVKVWWEEGEEAAAWFDGTIDRVMPKSVEVFYKESNTWQAHRFSCTKIKHSSGPNSSSSSDDDIPLCQIYG